MNNKLLVVAGANGAIGVKAVELALTKGSWSVLGIGRSTTPKHAECYGGNARYLSIDLAKTEAIAELTGELNRQHYAEVSWIHAVGHFCQYEPFVRQADSDVTQSINSNFVSLIKAVGAWAPAAINARRGRFMAYSTVSLHSHFPLVALLNACKAGTEAFIKSISNEILIPDVTLNCLALPTVMTEIEARLKPTGDYPHWLPPEVAAELTLARIEAHDASYARGATIPIFSPSPTYFGDSVLKRFSKSIDDLIQ